MPPTFERLRGKLRRQAEVLMSDLRRLSLQKTHMGLGDVQTQWYQRIKALLPHFLNNPIQTQTETRTRWKRRLGRLESQRTIRVARQPGRQP